MSVITQNNLVVIPLASGSKGNATYITDGEQGILIDCGISTRQLRARMSQQGYANGPLDAVLITHEHSDHVAAARILDKDHHKKTGVSLPFYMSQGTQRALKPRVTPTNIHSVQAGKPFNIGGITVEPFSVPHDTVEPIAYTLTFSGTRVGVITDLGTPTPRVEAQLASLDIAVLEFNHCTEMLLDGPYPWSTKERIRSSYGHLSNSQAAGLLESAAINAPRLQRVILAHLSHDNNTPELAQWTAHEALHRANRSDIEVIVAQQQAPIGPVSLH